MLFFSGKEQCDPFLAHVYYSGDGGEVDTATMEECFLQITEHYIVQRDPSDGSVTDDFDLRSVERAGVRYEDAVTDDQKRVAVAPPGGGEEEQEEEKMIVICLTFDTARRDHRERSYVMADQEDADVSGATFPTNIPQPTSLK